MVSLHKKYAGFMIMNTALCLAAGFTSSRWTQVSADDQIVVTDKEGRPRVVIGRLSDLERTAPNDGSKTEDESPSVVYGLSVLDDKGNQRIALLLGGEGESTQILVADNQGRSRVAMAFDSEARRSVMYCRGPQKDPVGTLLLEHLSGTSSTIGLLGATGNRAVSMELGTKGPRGLLIRDDRGPRVGLFESGLKAGLAIWDGEGDARIRIQQERGKKNIIQMGND